jgi:hypothetical protein
MTWACIRMRIGGGSRKLVRVPTEGMGGQRADTPACWVWQGVSKISPNFEVREPKVKRTLRSSVATEGL